MLPPQARSLACDTNTQLPGNTSRPQASETEARGEITLVESEDQVAKESTHTDVPSPTPASEDHPAATQSGWTRPTNVEVDPSRSVLGGEPGIELAGDEGGAESGLPVRHSRRLATKGK